VTLRLALPDSPPPIPRDGAFDLDDDDRALLLRRGRVGSMDVSCRIVMPAMESNLGTRDGRVSGRLIAYYAARARGGVAWVTTENTSIHPSGRVTPVMLRIETDDDGAAFAPLADAVHAAGSRLLVQLSHAGRQTLAEFAGGPPWAPSAIPCPVMKDEPRAMTHDDVRMLVDAFAAGARRAQRAGADGVELHMAHGYLLCGFLSPDSNRRDDTWGGDTERRCAFPAAVLRAIRSECGRDFVVISRISADEYTEDGIHPEEAVRIARALVDAGSDALHVSACNYESMFWNIPTYFLPEAPFASLAGRIRRETGVPVVAVGRIQRPAVAARVLRSGEADFLAMGRALIADPDLVAKVRARQSSRIRPCLACNRCIASINGARLECTVNPEIGIEGGDSGEGRGVRHARAPRRVVVVGAGVAGLAAALACVRRGEHVRLVERRALLGGQLDVAGMPPGKEPVAWYAAWLEGELRRAAEASAHANRLILLINRIFTPADATGADVLVWAAGSRPLVRRFPGDDALPHVPLDDAMRNPALAGPRPLVIGGGAGGAECAHWLATRGAQVTVVEIKRKIARDLIPNLRFHLERELLHAGVLCHTQVENLRFEGPGGRTARFEVRRAGGLTVDEVSAIVDAAGREPVPPPASEALAAAGFFGEVVLAGDAERPASIFEALAAARDRVGVT
jgi:2,4-dienoyl-CoA reductase-like NADH-dependent reductase (Old Yellow Enzyme family)/threonine dehydrogenase-like Zn-dependent dehydrogenase